MGIFASNIITSDSALGSAVIQRSLRFNSSDNTRLTRTPSSNGNKRTWTISLWIKRSTSTTVLNGLMVSGTNNPDTIIKLDSGRFEISRYGGGYTNRVTASAPLRDFSAWYHLVGAVDTTQSTAANRVRLYINGTEVTDFANSSYPSENYEYPEMNDTGNPVKIGHHNTGGTPQQLDGYLAEFNFIDGQQLDPSYFGFTDPQTSIWMPKRYEGTYGTNGFNLDFSDNSSTSTLGIDKSTNGNDFTASNLGTINCTKDSPSNNYCNLNPSNTTDVTFSVNNFKGVFGNSNARTTLGSIGLKSGKWYYEVYYNSATSDALCIGFANAEYSPTHYQGNVTDAFAKTDNIGYYGAGGGFIYYAAGTRTSEFTSEDFTAGDIIGVAADFDKNEIYFYKNGSVVSSANPYSYTFLDKDYLPCISNLTSGGGQTFTVNFGHDSSFNGVKTAQGSTLR